MAVVPYVFISYSSENTAMAEQLGEYLGTQGIAYWISSKCIPAGSDYTTEIPKAIAGCKAMVLLLTAEAQASEWIPKELDTAVNNKKPILPIHMDTTPLNSSYNFRFSNVQWIEGFGREKKAYKELVEQLRTHLIQEPPKDPDPKEPTGTQEAVTMVPCTFKDKVTGGTNSGNLRLLPDRMVFHPAMGQDSTILFEHITACSWPSCMAGRYLASLLSWAVILLGLILALIGAEESEEMVILGFMVSILGAATLPLSWPKIRLVVCDKSQKLLWRRRFCVIAKVPKPYRKRLLAHFKNHLKCRMPGV